MPRHARGECKQEAAAASGGSAMAAAGSREPPAEDEALGAAGPPPAAAAGGGGGGERESEGRAEGGGCYLALCARPVHFEKANPVNCVFFDEANKQVGAAGPCRGPGLRIGAPGLSPGRCCSPAWLWFPPRLWFLPVPWLPGVSPLVPLQDLSSC